MAHKIDQKIVGYKVLTEQKPELTSAQLLEVMSEEINRADVLDGKTYKIKPPQTEHALYITINDIVLNKGTDKEQRHPYEMFLNSKNMDSFQWMTSLTRVVSAVFRKGGDVTFLVEELKNVFDPRGGYFFKKRYMNSVVSHIGCVLEEHLKGTGYISSEPDAEQLAMMAVILKEKEFELRDKGAEVEFPEKATLCPKCSIKAVVLMDGCSTCLNCADSKCG